VLPDSKSSFSLPSSDSWCTIRDWLIDAPQAQPPAGRTIAFVRELAAVFLMGRVGVTDQSEAFDLDLYFYIRHEMD